MEDIEKSKEQLIEELAEIRQRVTQLELLLINDNKYYQFLYNLQEGIWVLDKDDCTTYVNPSMAEMLGYTEEEMLGKPVFSFMDEDGVKLTMTHMERRKQGVKEQFDFEFVCKDGRRIQALLETSPILDDDGNYVGAIAGVQDITERRSLEEQIRQQRDFLTSVLESLPHPFYVVDVNEYTIKMANHAAAFDPISERSTCYTLTHGRSEPCAGTEHICPLDEIKKAKKPVIVEHLHRDRQGNPRYVEVHAYPIIDERGKVAEAIVYTPDITERKQIEEERVEKAAALARAEELHKSRQRIVAAQESMRRDIAQQLHGSIQNRLVVQLHQLSELEQAASSEELSRKLANLRQNMTDLLDNYLRPIAYQLYPSILRRGLVAALQSLRDRLEVNLFIKMVVDEDLVRQEKHNQNFISESVRLATYRVAEEALSNVIKHAKANKVLVNLKLTPQRTLHLTVKDNGRGFDMDSVSGGLGLLFMHDYAELVGGKCIIHSDVDGGTEVTFTLPLAGAEEQQRQRAESLE